MQQELVEQALFKITWQQLRKIRPYIENITYIGNFEDLLKDFDLFKEELNDAIVYYLDSNNGYEHTKESIVLEEIYDEVYIQNKSEE